MGFISALCLPVWGYACSAPSRLHERVVLIEKFQRGKGSGILYDTDTVLTNRHVVADIEQVWVWLPALQQSVPADVIATAAHADLALLKLRPARFAPQIPRVTLPLLSPLALQQPKPEDPLFLIGFPFGEKHRLSQAPARFLGMAHLEARPQDKPVLHSILQGEHAFGGDSGGGMFSCSGALAGIHFASSAEEGQRAHVFAVSSHSIQTLLQKSP